MPHSQGFHWQRNCETDVLQRENILILISGAQGQAIQSNNYIQTEDEGLSGRIIFKTGYLSSLKIYINT